MDDERRNGHQHMGGSPSRALIAVSAEAAPDRLDRVAQRPEAGFVAQLIACRERVGIYRQARRTEPGEAAAAYRLAARTA